MSVHRWLILYGVLTLALLAWLCIFCTPTIYVHVRTAAGDEWVVGPTNYGPMDIWVRFALGAVGCGLLCFGATAAPANSQKLLTITGAYPRLFKTRRVKWELDLFSWMAGMLGVSVAFALCSNLPVVDYHLMFLGKSFRQGRLGELELLVSPSADLIRARLLWTLGIIAIGIAVFYIASWHNKGRSGPDHQTEILKIES